MKKIVFGGIYIFAGLLLAIVLKMYGYTVNVNPLGYLILLSIISIVIGIFFTIKGLWEK